LKSPSRSGCPQWLHLVARSRQEHCGLEHAVPRATCPRCRSNSTCDSTNTPCSIWRSCTATIATDTGACHIRNCVYALAPIHTGFAAPARLH
jgi:hypothetical protein